MNEVSQSRPGWPRRVAILGVGLLGGSVGKSLRRRGIAVSGFCRRSSTAEQATRVGAVDQAFSDVASACRDCDVAVIASPVNRIAELAQQADAVLPAGALITDVGSTKGRIVKQIRDGSPSAFRRFVAAHPIAGSEKTGVEHADATLLDGKVVVITPYDGCDESLVDRADSFWSTTGGRIIRMSPEEHDRRLASVSHVPHLVASLLACFPDPTSMDLVGSGWKDLTRVASGDPAMWTAICNHNREAILCEIDRLAERLQQARSRIADPESDELTRWLTEAKHRRDTSQ